MSHFFDKRDPWGNGISLWVILAMVLFAPLIGLSLKHIELENDVAGWLPSDDPQSRVLNWYSDQFPIKDTLLISWDGCALDDPRIDLFIHKLRGIPKSTGEWYDGNPYVSDIHSPLEALRKIVDRGVEPAEAIDRLSGILVGPGLLRVKLTEEAVPHLNQIQAEIRQQLEQKVGVKVYFEQPDHRPTLEELTKTVSPKLIARAQSNGKPAFLVDEEEELEEEEDEEPQLTADAFLANKAYDFQIGWNLMHVKPETKAQIELLLTELLTTQFSDKTPIQDTFYTPGSRVAMSLALSPYAKPEKDASAAKKAAIASIRADAEACGIPVDSLRLGGSPYASAELSHFVRKSVYDKTAAESGQYSKISPMGLSTLVAILLAFLMLRSFRLAALVLIVSVYTTLLTVSTVPLTGGNMNMVLIVMPTLLTVLTLSAAIHVANYWKHAAQENIHTAVIESVRMAWQPCALASITTAIGLLSLTSSPLGPVREFGAYSAVGCLVSLVMVLFGLPALLQYWPAKPPKMVEVDRSPWRKLGNVLFNHKIGISVSCMLFLIGSTWGLHYFTSETKVIRYFPDDAKIVEDYNYLEENLAGIIPIDTVLIFDKLAQDESFFWHRMETVRKVQNAIKAHPEISGTISLASFEKVPQIPSKKDGRGARRNYLKRINSVKNKILEPVDETGKKHAALKYFAVAENATEFNEAEDELWKISAQVSILSDMDYEVLTKDLHTAIDNVLNEEHTVSGSTFMVEGVKYKVTGMVPLFLRTQQAVLESLIKSFGLAFLLIATVMVILLKNPIAGVLTMLPNLLPIGVVFGLISWWGMPVDIGTMITASVALGIAVDGTLHLLTWFREGITTGKSRRDSVLLALEHCGPAMWHTSAVVGISLLMLGPADLLLVSRFGLLMAALVGSALIADLIFLPALLAGPLGALIERTVKKDPNASSDIEVQTQKRSFRVVSAPNEQSSEEAI